MDQEIKDYYEKYYNVELTDEDLQEIYNPARQQPANRYEKTAKRVFHTVAAVR